MKLDFSIRNNNEPVFNWLCLNCNTLTLYKSQLEIDFANHDFKSSIDYLTNKFGLHQEVVVNEIKSQMPNILKHFIECHLGWHYNALFQDLIKPYLDSPLVLDYVLKSNVVEKGNVTGKTGAKIYTELLDYLKTVDSPKIKAYLNEEFNLHNYEINDNVI